MCIMCEMNKQQQEDKSNGLFPKEIGTIIGALAKALGDEGIKEMEISGISGVSISSDGDVKVIPIPIPIISEFMRSTHEKAIEKAKQSAPSPEFKERHEAIKVVQAQQPKTVSPDSPEYNNSKKHNCPSPSCAKKPDNWSAIFGDMGDEEPRETETKPTSTPQPSGLTSLINFLSDKLQSGTLTEDEEKIYRNVILSLGVTPPVKEELVEVKATLKVGHSGIEFSYKAPKNIVAEHILTISEGQLEGKVQGIDVTNFKETIGLLGVDVE